MASVDWQKIKSRQQVKAVLRHNCKDTRQQTVEHSNPHLQPGLTVLNTGAWEMYGDAVQRYEERYAEVTKGKTVRRDAVVGLGFSIPVPDQLPEAMEDKWVVRVLELMGERYGRENMISCTVHRDEKHTYIDPDTHERKMSRTHAQGILFPELDGKLCAKQVMTRARMAELNRAIDTMSQKEFGVSFMTGTGQRSRGSVEQMKAKSLQAEVEELEARKREAERLAAEAEQRATEARNMAYKAEQAITAAEGRLRALERRQSDLEARVGGSRTEAEKALTSDERAVVGYLRSHHRKRKDGTLEEQSVYDVYSNMARKEAEKKAEAIREEQRQQEEAAAEARAQQKRIASFFRRMPKIAKRTPGTRYQEKQTGDELELGQ